MIPEAAVEAAARAMVRISRWEDVAGSSKMQLMLDARLALEAAAPHMRQAFFLEMNLRAVEDELASPIYPRTSDDQ